MIFSDNYTVHEKYSVLRQEHICTYSEMPWAYTPLVDDIYSPNLSNLTKNTLNNVLDYEYFWKDRDTIKNEVKMLGINHIDDSIISFQTSFRLLYACVRAEMKHFIERTKIDHLYEACAKIDIIVPNNAASFTGMYHNADGVPTAIQITDKNYNVIGYENDMLTQLVDYSRRNYDMCKGRLNVYNDNQVSITMAFQHPVAVFAKKSAQDSLTVDDYRQLSTNRRSVSRQQSVGKHVFGMRAYDFLTDDQCKYILSTLWDDHTKDFMMDLEYKFNSDGTLADIVCSVVKYHEFTDVPNDMTAPLRDNTNKEWKVQPLKYNVNSSRANKYTKPSLTL